MTDPENCQHEAPPYPKKRIVEDSGLLRPGGMYDQIVPCIHCGEPLMRPRDPRIMVTRSYVDANPQFDWSEWEGDE